MRYDPLLDGPGKTDWKRLRQMTDEEIEVLAADDPDVGPPTDEEFWKNAVYIPPPPKQAISIRLDKEVLDWFRSLGPGYQTRINMILRAYMERHRDKPE